MKIAVDVDGVLADIHTAVFQVLGLPYTWRDVKRWDFFEDLGIDKQDFWDAYRYVWDKRWDLIRLVDPDAVTVLQKLSKYHRIDIVTCRDKNLMRGTAIWLALKRIPYDNLVILPPKCDKSQLKDYDVIIDDNPELVKDPRLILFVRPWNEHVARGVRRIYSFKDLYYLIRPNDGIE